MSNAGSDETRIELVQEFDEDENEQTWFRVTSGRLAQPIDLKVKIQPGRAKVVGLRIDNGREVTSSELRLPLSELANSVYDWFTALAADITGDLQELENQVETKGLKIDWPRLDGVLAGAVVPSPADDLMLAIVDLVQAQGAIEQLRQELAKDEAPTQPRGRGAKPPTDEEYERFARVFESERQVRARGAQSRTAKRLNMDRSTALRWIRVCQERGLLESRAEKR